MARCRVRRGYKILFIVGCLLSSCADSDEPESPASACQLLEQEGSAEHPKIIGGMVCSQETVPVAKIALYDDEDNRDLCTGVLIASRFVLSAAHCLHDAIVRVTVDFGDKTYGISAAYVHPLYRTSGDKLLNDLMIYELVESPEKLKPVRLVGQEPVGVGTDLYLFGYGFATAGSLPIDELGILRAGVTTIESVNQDFITARFHEGGSNICFGDSGGPAIVLQENQPLLVGVTSSGSNSACGVGDVSSFVNLQGQGAQRFIQDALGGKLVRE